MATDIFLDLGDDIKGECKDSVYEGAINVNGWDWGMSQPGSFHEGGGGGCGKVSVQNITISKYVDTASTNLMLYCCTGKHFDEGKLVVRKAGGEQIEYFIITLKKILVTNISTTAEDGADRMTESVSLNFAEFSVDYTEQMNDGSGGATMTFGFNIEENIEV